MRLPVNIAMKGRFLNGGAAVTVSLPIMLSDTSIVETGGLLLGDVTQAGLIAW